MVSEQTGKVLGVKSYAKDKDRRPYDQAKQNAGVWAVKVSEALDYMVSTDAEYGALRGLVDGLEYRLKIAEAQGYLQSDGTQEQRKAEARNTAQYKLLAEELENSKIDFHVVGAKRKTAELHIEVWRTQQANKRQGNI